MNRYILLVILAIFMACGSDKTTSTETKSTDNSFDTYKNDFVENLWKLYPGWASNQGYHKYDSLMNVPDDEFRSKELDFCKAHLDSLKSFDLDNLSTNNKTDYYLIENTLESIRWNVKEYKEFEWNPSYYNVGGTFAEILSSKHAPLEEKLRMLHLRMLKIPAYYQVAMQKIKNPTVVHTKLAMEQNTGSISVFEEMIKDSINNSKLSTHEQDLMLARVKESGEAIRGFISWLEKLKNDNPKDFRLGKDLYKEKFQYDIQSSFSAEEIYEKAKTRKAELHAEMAKITKQLWPKYFDGKEIPKDSIAAIKAMISKLSETHVSPDSFQIAIERQIPELVDFIKKKDLIYLDPSKPLVIRKEPAYMQGVAGASISAPGPYDKGGDTYYNVGSLGNYTKEQAESYLREYNHYILQILNIHEAIPGHYTQLIYSNQSPSIIKSLFGNGAMIEGWAVYTERMMLEEGYGNNEPEMWLMYYKWHLRVVCNTILDYSVHNLNMSDKEAMELLTRDAFQEEAEARGKWRRVSLTQVQLCSYFTGYTEIYELREEIKKKRGAAFNLKQFHEEFLSYGSAPVKYIRKLMLEKEEAKS